MRILFGFLFLFFPLAAVTVQPHHNTAFIGQPDEFNSLWSYSHYDTNHFWNKNNKLLPSYNHFRRQAYTLWMEYAVFCEDSITFNMGYDVIREELNGATLGFEDCQLGWKHIVYSSDTAALTTQILALIPSGKKRSSLRYGKPGFQAGLLYSNQFNRGFYDLNVAYRYYQGFPSDQIFAQGAIGYDLLAQVQCIAELTLNYGLCNGQSHKSFNNIVFNPNYRLLNGQIELDYRLMQDVVIIIGGFKHLWGINVGQGGGIFCGAWIDL